MTSFSPTPRPAFIYSASDDTWYEISAKADTASEYEWGGDHSFLAEMTARYGINNFLNPTTRDTSITSPQRGAFCILRQNELGEDINMLQVYDGASWIDLIPQQAGNQDKFLKTNGIITSWEEVPDATPTVLLHLGG